MGGCRLRLEDSESVEADGANESDWGASADYEDTDLDVDYEEMNGGNSASRTLRYLFK
jgi:hypothetical protein